MRCPVELNHDIRDFTPVHISILPKHHLFAISIDWFLFPHYRIHLSPNNFFAESVRIELTWVLSQPWLSKPVRYRSANSPNILSSHNYQRRERDSNSWGFYTQTVFKTASSTNRTLSLVWVVRLELTQLWKQRCYRPLRLSNFVALTSSPLPSPLMWRGDSGWRKIRTFNQGLNKPLLNHWAFHPSLARRDSNPELPG